MFSLLCRPKPCRILMLLRDNETSWHLSKLAKNSDTTYVYVTKLMSNLQGKGLVNIEVKGKKRIVKLTERGVGAANLIHELKNKLDHSE
ncbi:Rrf2 family transcriptional regulator [Candidatus Micrarchaeota archaeon]|nr:Rrf2 family transcriptional regulator [Candidatus Micrarchaeota archaeon]